MRSISSRTSVSLMAEVVREARPKQWLKNVLVLAAPAAASVLFEWPEFAQAALAVVAMCAAASGAYYLNDVADVDADRQHPVKRHRPVAAGSIPLERARTIGRTLLLLALVVAAVPGRPWLVVTVAAYIALTLAYSAWLKHLVVVDLVAVAGGFVLRAVAGGVAVGVPLSRWFLLCASFGSLFVVAGKRLSELRMLGDDAGALRTTLHRYRARSLWLVVWGACIGAVVSYAMWVAGRDVSDDRSVALALSIPLLAAALLRYSWHLRAGRGDTPEDVFTSDRTLVVLGGAWLLLCGLGVYGA